MRHFKILLLCLFLPLLTSCGEDEPMQVDESKTDDLEVTSTTSIVGDFGVYFSEHPYSDDYVRPNNCLIWLNVHHLGEPLVGTSPGSITYNWSKTYKNAKFTEVLKESVEFTCLTNEGASYIATITATDFSLNVVPVWQPVDIGGSNKWSVRFTHCKYERNGYKFQSTELDRWIAEHIDIMTYEMNSAGEDIWTCVIDNFNDAYIINEIIPFKSMSSKDKETGSFDYYYVSVYGNKSRYCLDF